MVHSNNGITPLRFGIAYDPWHDVGAFRGNRADTYRRDLKQIKAMGFQVVRTFRAIFEHEEVGPYIADAGLKVALGINTETGHDELNANVDAAIRAANDPRGYVTSICVGNENLMHPGKAWQLMHLIRKIDLETPEHVQVGTVQRPNEWLETSGPIEGFHEMVEVSDFVGVNIYPFFSSLGGSMSKINMLNVQYYQVQNRIRHKKAYLMETGWPDAGGYNGFGNLASPWEAAGYYNEFKYQFFQQNSAGHALAPHEVFYFQFYDTPYKTSVFEPHFGLTYSNGYNKNHITI